MHITGLVDVTWVERKAAMMNPCLENETLAMLPTDERMKALRRSIARTHVDEVLAKQAMTRLSASGCQAGSWWFVAGLRLFCTDCYCWLQSFRPGSIAGRSTLCEVRKRLGSRPPLALLRRVVCLPGKAETPGAFYRRMRTFERYTT